MYYTHQLSYIYELSQIVINGKFFADELVCFSSPDKPPNI